MKSVFNNVFTCGFLMLASVAGHANAEDTALVTEMAHATLTIQHNAFAGRLSLDKMAASDDDQADSSEAETMLA